MKDKRIYFELSELKLCIISEDDIEYSPAFDEFLCAEARPDIEILVRRGEVTPAAGEGGAIYRGEVFEEFVSGGRSCRTMLDGSQRLIWERECRDAFRAELVLQREAAPGRRRILSPNNLALEVFLLHYKALFLHASVVRWNARGIVFTAPSGVGKSTQAELWRQAMGAEILNGDRALIRSFERGVKVYGSPFSGSSRIIKNERADLKMIVVLEQAKENRLTRLPKKTAFVKLYSEALSNPWNKHFVTQMMETLMELLERIPVYLLQCRPDAEAVEMVRQELENEDERTTDR